MPGGTEPGGTLPGGTLPGGTCPAGRCPGGTAPPGTRPARGRAPAARGRGPLAGPAGGPPAAASRRRLRHPDSSRPRDGTNASQPVVSISSWVQVGGGAGALAQRSMRKSSAQNVRAIHFVWKLFWKLRGDLLLALGGERLADLLAHVGQRLGRRRGHLLDLDHVVAGVGLERADELALGRGEDLFVERRLGLARRPRPGAGRRSTSSPRRSSTSSPPSRTTRVSRRTPARRAPGWPRPRSRSGSRARRATPAARTGRRWRRRSAAPPRR